MNTGVLVPSPTTSAHRLGQYLKRTEGLWMPSPSLALLSAFIAGAARPTRLLIREGSPSFIAAVGALVSAVPEPAPLDDSEELRLALRRLGSSADHIWGVATHRPEALVPNEWFEALGARGIPTVELCLGGLFELARRGQGAATVTIVSLDHEPAFEGAKLTALFTRDSALAQRVKLFCLAGAGANDGILDATPRGLAEDEQALQIILERAFARDEAEWTETRRTGAKTPVRGAVISHVWKRLFRSEPGEPAAMDPERPEPFPAPPPRGKSSWLARLAELEEKHKVALGRLEAKTESIRAEGVERLAQAQRAIDEWKARFGEAQSMGAAQAAQHSEAMAALDEARRENEDLERSLAARAEREARLTAEWEAALAERESQVAAQAFELASQRSEVLRSQSRDDLAAPEAKLHRAQEQAKEEAARLSKAQAETLARLEAQMGAAEKGREEALRRLAEALAERERDSAAHSLAAAEAEKARLALVAHAVILEDARTEALARIASLEDRTTRLDALNSATVAQRDEVASRLGQSDEAHREAFRLAEERAASRQRELLLEVARLNAAAVEGQARLEAATRAAMKKPGHQEEQHTALTARVEDQLALLVGQAKAAGEDHARAAASLAERISQLEKEKDALLTSRDDAVSHAGLAEESHREALRRAEERALAAQREHAAEVSRLNATLVESQARLDAAAQAAAREAERLEAHHAEAGEHAGREIALEKRLSVIETERAGLAKERDALAARLAEREEAHGQAQQRFEGRAEALAQENARERERMTRAETARQAHFDTLTRKAARESQRVEVRHAVLLARLQARVAALKGQKETAAKARAKEATSFAKRLSALETESQSRIDAGAAAAAAEAGRVEALHADIVARLETEGAQVRGRAEEAAKRHQDEAAAFQQRIVRAENERGAARSERDDLLTRLGQEEESGREALRVAERRTAALELEKVEEAARLNTALAGWQSRFEAAALSSAHESRRLETAHEALVIRLQTEAEEALRQMAAEAEARGREAAALAARLLEAEGEKAARAAEIHDLEGRMRRQEDTHREALRFAEQRASALLIEKLEEAGRREAALSERVSALDREKAETISRLEATAASGQSKLDAFTLAAAKEAQQLEASQAVLATRLQAEIDQLREERDAAVLVRAKEAAALFERLIVLESEKAETIGERDELRGRLQQMDADHRETMRLAEERALAWQREIVEQAERLRAAARESQLRETQHEARVQRVQDELARERQKAEAGARETAARAERLTEVERDTARISGERDRLEVALSQAEQRLRETVRSSDERLAEADTHLRSVEARLKEAAERERASSEAAERASASLTAALEGRARESAHHLKAAQAWEALRAILEARIAELQILFVGPPVPDSPLPRSRAPGSDLEGDPDSSQPDPSQPHDPRLHADRPAKAESEASLRFPEWEYERTYKDRQDRQGRMQGWLQGVAKRIRRE